MATLTSTQNERQPLLRGASNHDDEQRRPHATALVLLVLLSTGANWAESCLGPLKHMLLVRLSISNAQFGVLSAATQLANTLVPLAVVWVDVCAPANVAVAATLCVCIGSLATAVGAQSSSFALLVGGRIVQGLGVIVVDTTATKLLVRWHRSDGKAAGLSLVISLNFACDRLAATLSKASAVPLARWNRVDDPAATFWCATVMSAVSLASAVAYAHAVQSYEPPPSSTQRRQSPVTAIMRTFTTLPTFFVFLAVTQFYQPIAVFNNLAADVIRWKGASLEMAGYLASLGQAMPILLAPVLGWSFDRYGRRMSYVPLTALLLATTFAVLLYTDISPLVPMLIFSVGNAVNSPPYLCSLAILLRHDDTFGCAWGVWKSLMQSYQIIMNTTLGRLQDRTPGRGYEAVLSVLLASKALEFVWGTAYVVLDRRYMRGILHANDEQRRQTEAELMQGGDSSRHSSTAPSGAEFGLRPHRRASLFLGGYFVAVVLVAWGCFFGLLLSQDGIT